MYVLLYINQDRETVSRWIENSNQIMRNMFIFIYFRYNLFIIGTHSEQLNKEDFK